MTMDEHPQTPATDVSGDGAAGAPHRMAAAPSARPGAGRRTEIRGWRLALLTLASAVLSAAILAGVLSAAGAFDGGTTSNAAVPVDAGPTVGSASLHPAALYADVAPSVVDITSNRSTVVAGPFGAGREESTALGSGIVVDRRGDILTADHVVNGSSSVSIAFANGATRSARIVGQDPATDLAVLRIDPRGLSLKPLVLGDSAALQVGDPVIAIGDPFGYRRSMSAGIVSGLDRTIQGLNGASVAHAVQTDAAIDPGNSGGPLLDARGQVIGIVDQIATGSSGADSSTGVGFAISSNVARAELSALQRGSAPRHAYLGVEAAPAGEMGGGRGVVVVTVNKRGPAAKAGLRVGDIIDTVDGTPLRGVNDLIAKVSAQRPGRSMTLGVRRAARALTVRVSLGTEPTKASSG
jgi:putative serine protease PepD